MPRNSLEKLLRNKLYMLIIIIIIITINNYFYIWKTNWHNYKD